MKSGHPELSTKEQYESWVGKVLRPEKYRVHVCAGTHDYTDPALPLLRPEIRIGTQTWICANTFIAVSFTHLFYFMYVCCLRCG